MIQSGGPTALNGFLYQIIHHLGWMASVTLTGKVNGQEITEACLILEPKNGGDARAVGHDVYIVEQYKTRKNRTWSLNDIKPVLRDLWKAAHQSLPLNASYRFVTDGRAGRLDTFANFITDLKLASCPDELDNIDKKSFSNSLILTNRGFFDHINAVVQNNDSPSVTGELTTFHLLSNFEMKFCVSGSDHVAALESLLRPYAPNFGDEKGIREHLVGLLLEKLAKGETRLDSTGINSLFRQVGLNPERLHKLAILPETMYALTHSRLSKLQYDPGRDVRGIPKWPENKQILLIAGESGVGKTWQLGRLLETHGNKGDIVNLVLSARSREDLLTQISRDLWETGLGETSDKSIVAVAHFLRELNKNNSNQTLIVALDDVQDIDLARDLVRQDWSDWEIRLALTVPRSVARSLSMTDDDTVHVHYVDEFSVEELDLLLKQHSQRWVDLPLDLKKLLRTPILAGLYLKLPYSSFQSAPRSEYEIFDRFWQRIVEKGKVGDEGIVTALAAHMRKGKAYPLKQTIWHKIGLSNEEILERLLSTGWLRNTDNGEVAFAHDRLLNWAVAKSLVQEFSRGELSMEDLGAYLSVENNKLNQQMSHRLGYVPLDMLWLLAENPQNTKTICQLVGLMEDRGKFGIHAEELYADLLPTLGQRVIPVLQERLKTILTAPDREYQIDLIGKSFAALAKQESITLNDTIVSLLNSPSRDFQNVALAALTVAPDIEQFDRLWELHQYRCSALEDKFENSRHKDYTTSFAAMRAAISFNPAWLRSRILKADTLKENVSELGYLLNAMEHNEALEIWKESGHILMKHVPASKPRCLLNCIARFKDQKKRDFVINNLSHSDDYAGAVALTALSVLDPTAAVDRLVQIDDAQRYLSRNDWLPTLLHAQPELTQNRILELAKVDQSGYRLVIDLFWERPNQINGEMLRFVLRSLENSLCKNMNEVLIGDPLWLHNPFDFLGRINRIDLLEILATEAGSRLEEMITEVACSRLRTNSNYRDSIREDARRILILIGGEGITTMINRELDSEFFWVRHGGLNWAMVRNDNGIVEKLCAIASRQASRNEDGSIESSFLQEFVQATNALAALGSDTALVETLRNSGLVEVSIELTQLRAHRGLMPKDITAQTLQVMQSEDASEELLLTEIVIAWLSQDAGLISEMRSILERADIEGRIATYACIALQTLGDRSDEFARLAYRLLYTESNTSNGLQALIWLGNRGAKLLASWLQDTTVQKDVRHEVLAIRALYGDPTTRDQSIKAAVDQCKRVGFHFDGPYDIAAEAEDSRAREQVLDKAFTTHSIVTNQPLIAIKGLAKFDVERAIEAIELGLQFHHKVERQLCELLVRISPETAASQLINSAYSIDRKSLRSAIGRTLRKIDSEIVSNLIVDRMSGFMPRSEIAAELAGWLQPTPSISKALGNLADYHSTNKVKYAALAALERQHQEANVRSLLDSFTSATKERKWSILIAILETGDPHLLCDNEDALWIGSIFSDDIPHAFVHHANSVLQQRKKKVD